MNERTCSLRRQRRTGRYFIGRMMDGILKFLDF